MREIYDVAIVGYGPVGMAAAALLGRDGHRVVVLERYAGKYNLPRAAIFDDETMRTFAKLGIADELLPKVHVQRNYEWRNAAGELLIEHDFAAVGRSGWAEWYMMYQPDLEDALDRVCQASPSVDVRFDSRVTAISQSQDIVQLVVEDSEEPVEARYVIACDGGNSFVRRTLNVPMTDHGFSEPWMVCDFRLGAGTSLPMARQVCDPAQPISIISLGPDHHRFSFMLNSEDESERERVPDRVWTRVANYLRRDQAELIRAATYTFRSLIADRWRFRRILLAGDAAHQMPPFLGQGMCSGIRDALNLALKFNLILIGRQSDDILDTYQSEREPHVRAVTFKGIELGRVQTIRDPVAAATRDQRFLDNRARNASREKIVFPPLGPGLLDSSAAAGELFVQGRWRDGGTVSRFDAVVGYGPIIMADKALQSTLAPLSADATAAGVKLIFVSGGDHGSDIDGTYREWLRDHCCDIVAVRSDFHVWGTATATEAHRLTADFIERFGTPGVPGSISEDRLACA